MTIWFAHKGPLLVLVFAILSAPGPVRADSESLIKARLAYESLSYGRAKKILQQALGETVDQSQRIALYEMLVTVHLVLGEESSARRVFVEILTLKPNYKPPLDVSPKVEELFDGVSNSFLPSVPPPKPTPTEEPVKAEPTDSSPVPLPVLPPHPAVVGAESLPATSPWYRRWWVWSIAGAVVAGAAGATVWAYNNPAAPRGHVGPVPLP